MDVAIPGRDAEPETATALIQPQVVPMAQTLNASTNQIPIPMPR